MTLSDVNLYDLDRWEQGVPHDLFELLRREAPVFYEEQYGFWTVTRQEDVLAVLADDVRFSNRLAIPLPLPPASTQQQPAPAPPTPGKK